MKTSASLSVLLVMFVSLAYASAAPTSPHLVSRGLQAFSFNTAGFLDKRRSQSTEDKLQKPKLRAAHKARAPRAAGSSSAESSMASTSTPVGFVLPGPAERVVAGLGMLVLGASLSM
eukprot:CAMPEP_0173389890 /NCGR_PEP_ID=MMETSP1356-20130122/13856_1 /TAXON_ID=77927 ORGANISM="Hemiselmis virescens, Strain PCC157" /NCGR_SAMPLE_ID=MMETSP1356 /ASSEMBLY_ACC=CAM_ASM_000847 /LENGTH=116 /DNA_ID=CAMNT_0014347167 /DNA_START=87 /DNA_END=437 /DNA_ORIENTATION=+